MPLTRKFLLALTLAGAAQIASATVHNAPATIELVPCIATSIAPCTAAKPHTAVRAPSPVPEPHTFVMLMLGLVALGITSRRRESKKFSE